MTPTEQNFRKTLKRDGITILIVVYVLAMVIGFTIYCLAKGWL